MKAIFYNYKIVLKNGKLADYLEYVHILEGIYENKANYLLDHTSLTIYPAIPDGDAKLLDIVIKLISDNVPMEKGGDN